MIANMSQTFAVFFRFLTLGLLSFGGPIAHIGYFQKTFVERLQWLDQAAFMKLTTLCQVLPGPASSQLGFAIGLQRAGISGALAAFIGFTLPSFIIMTCVATYAPVDHPQVIAIIAGLKLAAVVVVADACMTMFQRFCDTPFRKGVAAVTTLSILLWPSAITQIGLLAIAAVAGTRPQIHWPEALRSTRSRLFSAPGLALAGFALILVVTPVLLLMDDWSRLWAMFYQAGSLVFGGGHVVLPLLEAQVGDLMEQDQFLMGYASAQAIPGPMFTFASFLGAEILPQTPWIAALVATLAIFTPGFLLVLAFVRGWNNANDNPALNAVFARVNAAVVGLLLAALVQPVLVSAVHGGLDTFLVLVGLLAVRLFKLSVLWLLLGMVVIALARNLTGF